MALAVDRTHSLSEGHLRHLHESSALPHDHAWSGRVNLDTSTGKRIDGGINLRSPYGGAVTANSTPTNVHPPLALLRDPTAPLLRAMRAATGAAILSGNGAPWATRENVTCEQPGAFSVLYGVSEWSAVRE